MIPLTTIKKIQEAYSPKEAAVMKNLAVNKAPDFSRDRKFWVEQNGNNVELKMMVRGVVHKVVVIHGDALSVQNEAMEAGGLNASTKFRCNYK